MKPANSNGPGKPGISTGDAEEKQQWRELRRHLVGSEIAQLDHLEERLDDPALRAAEISRVLPEAITLRTVQDDKIARALQPAVDQSLRVSVAKNPKALAEAIFPALGPGIRKAIRATITGMIQSLNTILNRSFSLRGLKWRIEAFRTQTSFAEVVLLHTLVYQVEQIFLIHRSTGIVLQHADLPGVGSKDPDLVSGMLTAIQDFMKDSFQSDGDDEIETLRMGKGRSVWVEQGSDAIIAAVIRGRPPVELRQQFREMTDIIHQRYRKYLDEFKGDVTPFSVTKDLLEDGITFKVEEGSSRTVSPVLVISLVVIAFAAAVWGFAGYRRKAQFDEYVQRLKAEPGIVVVQTERQKGRVVISGLRDPLARSAVDMARETGLDTGNIVFQWESYVALHPDLVAARARKRLNPPETVSLLVNQNTLIAAGEAPHAWVTNFRKQALLVPGIQDYVLTALKDTDLEAMQKALQAVSSIKIYFDQGKSDIRKDQIGLLDKTAEMIHKLQAKEPLLGKPLRIGILGYADATGTEVVNQWLSQERAQQVRQHLLARGISPRVLFADGKGSLQREKYHGPSTAPELDRVVTLNAFQDEDSQ